MTVLLDQQWQDSCLDIHKLTHNPTQHNQIQRKKAALRASPEIGNSHSNAFCARPKLSSVAVDSNLLSPLAITTPSPTSQQSPSKFKKMHIRVRSISGSKTPLSARQIWDRLPEADKAKSERFTKDAVAICGLGGYSWRKTHEYLNLARELPLPPDFVVDADDVPPPTPSESRLRFGSFLEKKTSSNSLLTPESASARTSPSRPDTPSSSLTSVSSTVEPDLKPVLTNIRLLFEKMQQSRDPLYMHYINLPDNNLKKMHAMAVAAHRAATLKKERSSLMDAIEFDKKAEKATSMEMAVAKLRFEMELDMPDAAPASLEIDSKSTGSISSRPTQVSSKSNVSSSVPPAQRRPLEGNMRFEASQNNRISGVPTITTTVSDFNHLRHLSTASSIDRPDSPASAMSDNHVQSKETWRRLQEAKARLSRRSRSRVDGASQPGRAQKIDENGFFSSRPPTDS